MTRQRPDRRRLVAIGALVGVVAIAAGGLAIADNSSSSSSATTTIDPNSLPPVAKELYFLTQKGANAVFHAVYAAESPQYTSANAEATLESWHEPGKARQDVNVVSPTQTQKSEGFALPVGVIQCQELQGHPLCQLTGKGFQDVSDRFLAAVSPQLLTADITATDEAVGQYPARCFSIPDAGKICLDPKTGALLLLDSGGLVYTVTKLDQNVSDDDFVPPGPVVDISGNPVSIPGQTPITPAN